MNFLIVGCGLSGITIGRLLTNYGHSCLIIDERNNIGGNCYTEKHNDSDIHIYGPHIFHTSNKDIWDFVNRYSDFISFQLNVKSFAKDNNYYSLPFTMNTFKEVYGITDINDANRILADEIKKSYQENPKNLEQQALNLVGKTIYELLIKEYTEKQWGRKCTELDPSIITRLPVRFSWNNNYYNDIYQGIPKYGYTELLMNIINGLDNEQKIEYKLNTKFIIDEYSDKYDKIIYTGQIDRLLNYQLGELEWRSLNFEHKELDNNIDNDQGCPVITYPSHKYSYTRTIDHYYFNHIQNDYKYKTKILTYEYPQNYDRNKIAYYPVNNEKNQELYEKYVNILNEKYPNIMLLGRLGLYRYFDMDDAIENCFNFLNKLTKNNYFNI